MALGATALLSLVATTATSTRADATPYIGVTDGFSNSNLEGPYTAPHAPLFNPVAGQMAPTWDDWVEEAAAAGVDYLAPDQRGSTPVSSVGDPTNMVDLVTALANRGLDSRIKIAIFDDNATSWTAQWNEANGRGFAYAEPFDISDSANWAYIWDYNYKIFYESVPDANRFKIDGRPVIIIWTMSPTFVGNASGNASRMLSWLRTQAQTTFGFDPYIIVSSDWLIHDPSSAALIDAQEAWFVPSANPGSYTVKTYNGATIGVAVPAYGVSVPASEDLLLPNHGVLLQTGLTATYQGGSELTLLEGFDDTDEGCSLFRFANLDPTGAPLTYDQTGYDYPSQRLDILRDFSSAPFPQNFKAEAEAADSFGGGKAGSPANYYRNGAIDIEPTTDVNVGYDVTGVHAGEWLEWERIPLQGGGIHLTARVASPSGGGKLHFVVDGTSYPSADVPSTGGAQTWTNIDTGIYSYSSSVYHVVRLVADAPGFSVNYWQTSTDVGFYSGLEPSDPQPTWTDSADTAVSGQENVTGATCGSTQEVAHFESSLKVAGTAAGDGPATYACRVFDLSSEPVVLDAESSLSYFVHPQEDDGRYVAVDLHFTDGTFLSSTGLKDQNGQAINAASGHGGAIPLGLWSLVSADLSGLAGKQVDRIDVVFSRTDATGSYVTYLDDILVTSATRSTSPPPSDAGSVDATTGPDASATTVPPEGGVEASFDGGGNASEDAASGASGGCGCHVTGGSGPGGTALSVAAIAIACLRRRKERAAARGSGRERENGGDGVGAERTHHASRGNDGRKFTEN